MTKREICERLMNIHNRLLHEYAMADGMEDIGVEEICKDLCALILDLAAPEEKPEEPEEKPEAPKWVKCPRCGKVAAHDLHGHGYLWCDACNAYTFGDYRNAPEAPEPETPKAEEKHPGIIVDPSGKNPPHCLKCGGKAKTHHNLFAAGDEWVMCDKCIAMFRVKPKRGEGEK